MFGVWHNCIWTEDIVLNHPDTMEVIEVNTAVVIIAISREVAIVAAVAIAVTAAAAAAGATAEATVQAAAQQVGLCCELNANGGPQSPV